MNILITGGTGFIGSWLLKKIDKYNFTLISSKKRVGFIKLDLHKSNFNILNKKKFDACIHLAWSKIPDYSKKNSLENYESSKALFRYLYKNGCKKIISLGSCWEYKEDFGIKNERNDCISNNIFGVYKKKLANYGLKLSKKYKMKFIWFRVFYVYGDKKKGLLKSLEEACYKNKKIFLNNPYKINDFIFIEDVIQNILNAIEKGNSGIYNLGSGKANTTLDFCKVFTKIKGKNLNEIVYYDQKKIKTKREGIWACMKKSKRIYAHKKYVSLNKGIRELLKR
jgi:nucleoside-diphosphate-sugar epimerase